MKYDHLKKELKRFEGMYDPKSPLVALLQQVRLAIIDMEIEIKELKVDEQV